MAVDDVYRVALLQRIGTNQFVNVLHYQTLTSGHSPIQEAEGLAEGIEEAISASWVAYNVNTCVLDTISVRGVTQPTVGIDRSVGLTGIRSGDSLPYQVSPLVLLRTGKIGRSFNGKVYLPPGVEADSIGGTIVNAAQVLIEAYVEDLLSSIPSGYPGTAFGLVVYSRKYSVANLVTTRFMMPQMRTQRRRTPGRGS